MMGRSFGRWMSMTMMGMGIVGLPVLAVLALDLMELLKYR